MTTPCILLLQARTPDDPILAHELACFARRADLPEESFDAVNLADNPPMEIDFTPYDAVMVGGAGDFSVVEGGFPWHEPMLDLMRHIVAIRIPMFASCFGFQALVQALGGELARDPDRAELGTHRMTLTPEGQSDPLFRSLPVTFDAQLGHNDSATSLPADLINLASSERCALQAVRHRHAPVVATQFHPELTAQDNITRYLRYLEAYKESGESDEEARQRAQDLHRSSPHVNRLMRIFVENLDV